MPETLFKVDLTKPMNEQEVPGHNRWHPDIPAVSNSKFGSLRGIDWTDGVKFI
jgi:formamidase